MCQAFFSPREECFVCRQVTSSPVIGPSFALKFPLAIYRNEQKKPKSFPQLSTNFLLSTSGFCSFSSSVLVLLCELYQRRTLKDPFLKPLNVLLNICLKTTLKCRSFDMKSPKYKDMKNFCGRCMIEKPISGLLRLLGE